MHPRTLRWENNALVIIDQTRLPLEHVDLACRTVDDVVTAIKTLAVRGAPAIGVAGAYGVAIAALADMKSVPESFRKLAASRPTAVNLFWALDRMRKRFDAGATAAELLEEAQRIEEDDIARCRRIGDHGAPLLPDNATVITHCNAGALATAGMGTALAVIYRATELGKKIKVFSDETRPLLQGARITMWELMQAGIDATLITDGMAAAVMSRAAAEGKSIDAVIVGTDRVAANGDVANKIGTFGLALAARHHKIPFYVAAPCSTIDPTIPDGRSIPIEERDADEITQQFGRRTAPLGAKVFNPAFDVTPHEFITALITDRGVVEASAAGVARALACE